MLEEKKVISTMPVDGCKNMHLDDNETSMKCDSKQLKNLGALRQVYPTNVKGGATCPITVG